MEIHLVMDNYATHKTPKVENWFKSHPHYTPTSASWLNKVERWFTKITEERIRRGVFLGVKDLEKAIMDYIEAHNKDPKPLVWTASADLILEKVKFNCKQMNQSPH